MSNQPLLDSSGYASSSEKTTSHKDDVFYNVVTFLSALKLMCIIIISMSNLRVGLSEHSLTRTLPDMFLRSISIANSRGGG